MTAELRRGLMLAGIGLASGFALIVALFGPTELGKRATTLFGSTGNAPSVAGQSDASDAKPNDTPNNRSGPTADRGMSEDSAPSDAAKPKVETLPETGPAQTPSERAPKDPPQNAANDPAKDTVKAGSDDAPSLDIVRVEPSGDAVIAGRTTPNASVELLRDNKAFAQAKADASGNFAIVPPTLPAGNSEISYRSVAPDGSETRGKESVAIVVAENRSTKPLVAVSTPDKPTTVLSQPDAVPDAARAAAKTAEAKAAAEKAPAKPPQRMSALPEKPLEPNVTTKGSAESVPLKIVSIDAQEGGRLDVTGMAKPGVTLRLYLNDTMVASGKTGPDGRIAFTIGRGVRAGGYQVRVDQVDPATGKVEHRAQVAFAFPESAAAPKIAARDPAPATAPPPPIPGRPDADKTLPGQAATRPNLPLDGPSTTGKPAASGAEPPRVAQAPTTERKAEAKAETINSGGPAARQTPAAEPPSSRQPVDRSERNGAGEKPAPSMTLLHPQSPLPSVSEKTEPRPVAETPAAAAAAKPQASPAPTSDSDRRTAEALAPKLPPAAAAQTDTPKAETMAELAPATPEPEGTVFVPEISTAKITRGDNLWQISRRSYGSGLRYTVIFDANKDQIKDPNRIYPGQIFVLPKDEATAKRG